MVDGCVVRNLVDPGGEFEFGAVATEGAVNLDEDLLGKVERGFVVADHAVDVS